MSEAIKNGARILAITSALALVPIAWSSNSGPALSSACGEDATGTCCKEHQAICNAGAEDHVNYYYKESGSCGL